MNKRKKRKLAKSRLARGVGLSPALIEKTEAIQSRLDSIEARLGIMVSPTPDLESAEALAKERLAARARDNLRIESLKKIYRLAHGNHKYASEADAGCAETLESLRRRLSFMKGCIEKLLNDEGVRPIAPSRNDDVSESEHRVVQTIAPDGPGCEPGHVAECLEIGFAVHGVITPAEVTVFASGPESDRYEEANQ